MNTVLILGIAAIGIYLLMQQTTAASPAVTAPAATTPSTPTVVDSSGAPAAGVPPSVIVTPPASVTPTPARSISFNIPEFTRIPLAQDTTTGEIVVPVSQDGTVVGLPVTSQPIVESLNWTYDYLLYLGQSQSHTSAEWMAWLKYVAPNVPLTDPGTGYSDLETFWQAVQPQLIAYVKSGSTATMAGMGWIT